jgi:hypothetical protein
METKVLFMMLIKSLSTVLAASIQDYKTAVWMDLTLLMVFTDVALLLHNYYVLGLMVPIQSLKAKFHPQIFQMDIL